MREPEIISREIQDVKKLYEKTQEFSQQYPDDDFLRLNLRELEQRHEDLVAELYNSTRESSQQRLTEWFRQVWSSNSADAFVSKAAIGSYSLRHTPWGEPQFANWTMDLAELPALLTHKTVAPSLASARYSRLFSRFWERLPFFKTNELVAAPWEKVIESCMVGVFRNRPARFENRLAFYCIGLLTNDKEKSEHPGGTLYWSAGTAASGTAAIHSLMQSRLLLALLEPPTAETEFELPGALRGISLLRFEVEFEASESRDVIVAGFAPSLAQEAKQLIDQAILARFRVTTRQEEGEARQEYELLALEARVAV